MTLPVGNSGPCISKEQLSRARAEVAQAIEALLSPTPKALDRCALLLQAATKNLTGSPSVSGETQGALEEARQLQRAVRRARMLLDAAFEFHRQWNRRLGALSGGYTSEGEPAAVKPGFRLVLRG
jgi:hypothetical protein